MAVTGSASTTAKAKQTLSKEQIFTAFNDLRQQQRIFASKMSEMEMDMKEHDLVIDVLKDMDPSRKCYRMLGGVLIERKVETVLPGLIHNREKMKEYTDSLRNNLESKGRELNQFRETHGIQIKADSLSDDKKDEVAAPKTGERQPNILASI